MVTKRCRQRNLHEMSYTIKHRVKTRISTGVAVSTERVKLDLFSHFTALKLISLNEIPLYYQILSFFNGPSEATAALSPCLAAGSYWVAFHWAPRHLGLNISV